MSENLVLQLAEKNIWEGLFLKKHTVNNFNSKMLPFIGGLLNRSLPGIKMVDNRRRVTLQEQIFNAEVLRFRSKKQRDSHTFAYKIYRHGLPSTPESSL